MKIIKHTIFAVAILSSTCVFSQSLTEDQVPLDVQTWLYKEYPGATSVRWGADKDESGTYQYTADLVFNGQEVEAMLDRDGNILEKIMKYNKDQVPVQLVEHAQSNYDKVKVLGVNKHENFEYNGQVLSETTYELILKVGKEETTIWFNADLNRQETFDARNLAGQ